MYINNFYNSTASISSDLIAPIISGVFVAIVVYCLNNRSEKRRYKRDKVAFFLEKQYENVYYLNIHTLLKGEYDEKIGNIPFTRFNYKNEYKEYKQLTVLLSYLFDEPIDKVTYFTFKERKSSGMYSYTLDRKKYSFVLDKFKELKMPIMSSEFNEEIFSRDTE